MTLEKLVKGMNEKKVDYFKEVTLTWNHSVTKGL